MRSGQRQCRAVSTEGCSCCGGRARWAAPGMCTGAAGASAVARSSAGEARKARATPAGAGHSPHPCTPQRTASANSLHQRFQASAIAAGTHRTPPPLSPHERSSCIGDTTAEPPATTACRSTCTLALAAPVRQANSRRHRLHAAPAPSTSAHCLPVLGHRARSYRTILILWV